MKAPELTDLAHAWLRDRNPNALIVRELGVSEWGGSLVDVAAVLEDRILGVEIKGEGDSPTRLPRQGMFYGRVCRTMFLLPDAEVFERCEKHLPPGWRLLSTERRSERWKRCGPLWREGYAGDRMDTLGLGLSPVALAAMVWTREYTLFGGLLGHKLPRRKDEAIECVSELAPVRRIERAVCEVLRRRDWSPKSVDFPESARPDPEARIHPVSVPPKREARLL